MPAAERPCDLASIASATPAKGPMPKCHSSRAAWHPPQTTGRDRKQQHDTVVMTVGKVAFLLAMQRIGGDIEIEDCLLGLSAGIEEEVITQSHWARPGDAQSNLGNLLAVR